MIVAATEEEAVTGEEHATEALDKGMTDFALMLSEVRKSIPSMSLFHWSGPPHSYTCAYTYGADDDAKSTLSETRSSLTSFSEASEFSISDAAAAAHKIKKHDTVKSKLSTYRSLLSASHSPNPNVSPK